MKIKLMKRYENDKISEKRAREHNSGGRDNRREMASERLNE